MYVYLFSDRVGIHVDFLENFASPERVQNKGLKNMVSRAALSPTKMLEMFSLPGSGKSGSGSEASGSVSNYQDATGTVRRPDALLEPINLKGDAPRGDPDIAGAKNIPAPSAGPVRP